MVPNLRDTSTQTHLELLKQEDPEIQGLLAVYPEEASEKILANKQKIGKIIEAFKNMHCYANANTIVMTCRPLTCPYKDMCVLKLNDMAPDSYQCPIERKLVMELEADLMNSLKIDTSDIIETEMLWDLIEAKLLDMRASGSLKNGAVVQIVQQQVAKVLQTKEEISPVLLIKLDIKRLKHSIIDSFIATRRSKKKYGMANDITTLESLVLAAAAKNRIEHKDE